MLNERTVNVKMKRIELCDLLLATTCIANATNESGNSNKWRALHDMLKKQLDEFDEKHADEI